MTVFAVTGHDPKPHLRLLQTSLAHRGKTQCAGSVGGEFVESEGEVEIAWSGTILQQTKFSFS